MVEVNIKMKVQVIANTVLKATFNLLTITNLMENLHLPLLNVYLAVKAKQLLR